ncbi:MAG TPA: hypothetical protein VL494_13550 [Steroidobacteraceae bacterium]|nr:hypothetical protein [Steroidobacteraceae bacterium]
MSWIELDDGILDHPKFVRAIKLAGPEALFLWLGLRVYCAKYLTDGFVPDDMLDEVRGPRDPEKRAAAMAALFEVELLEKTRRGGLQMHDYLHWSKSREQVLAAREQARIRKGKSRGPSGGSHGGGHAGGHGDRHAVGHGVTPGVTTTVGHAPAGSGGGDGDLSVPKATTDQSGSPRARELVDIARRILKNPYDGEYLQPSLLPEVQAVAAAWSFGNPVRLGNSPKSDSDLRAILEAIAAENPIPDLLLAGSLAGASDWFADPKRRHPGAFTPAVLRRLLASNGAPAAPAPDFAAAAAAQQLRETFGEA